MLMSCQPKSWLSKVLKCRCLLSSSFPRNMLFSPSCSTQHNPASARSPCALHMASSRPQSQSSAYTHHRIWLRHGSMPVYNIPSTAADVAIACVVGIAWTTFTFLCRCFLRTKVNGPFGPDDMACGVATVCHEALQLWHILTPAKLLGIFQSIVTLAAVHFGLGYHATALTASNLKNAYICLWVAEQLYVLATAATMLSISCLICRITTARTHHLIGYTIGFLIVVWAVVCWSLRIFICSCFPSSPQVASQPLTAYPGDLPRPWDIRNNICLNRSAIRLGTTVVSAILELANVVTAVCVV